MTLKLEANGGENDATGGPAQRPTSVAAVRACLSRFATAEGRQRGLDIAVRPDDIFIATYPKCGTTWMQQIVHGLRTRGSMQFAEISAVVPWLEMAHDIGMDPAAEQVARPRAFKSHLHWGTVPKGGRYIHVTRDPEAVAISLYRFFEGWMFVTGSIDIDSFMEEFFTSGSGSGRYWDHLLQWWPARTRHDVLFLCYEDLVANPVAGIRRVARLMEIELDDALLRCVLEQSSRAFMAAHDEQFNDHLVRGVRDPVMRLPPGGTTTKVQARAVDDRYQLGPHSLAALESMWQEQVLPATGFASYAELRRALAA